MLLGRALLPSDTPPPEKPASVIMLGYNLWQRRFQGDTNVLGKVVRLSRFPPVTVVGVMPPDIRFLPSTQNSAEPNYDVDASVDYWVPGGLATDDKDRRWDVVSKLREKVTPQEAQAKLSAGNAIPRLDDVKLGWAVLLFSLTAGIVASILAGFAPAFQTAWLHGAEGLKDAAGTSSAAPKKRRFLTSVAILQTALTLVLLV